ncbi:MAG TPA: ATP-binding protein [Pseudomonadales bacterium]|nr:ATP-binding protein [Pseudomonadales bacterium]
MTLELHATPEEVMRAVGAFEEFAQGQTVPEKFIHQLTLALEECASNIVKHALQGDAQRTFKANFGRTENEVFIELRDNGPAFDPTVHIDRRREDDAEAHGGWGIELVRRFMDELSYRRVGEENVLRLVKRLDTGGKI